MKKILIIILILFICPDLYAERVRVTGGGSGGGGSGDITSVGNVSSGAAFDGTQGTILTFYNAGGNLTLTYDGSTLTSSKSITANVTGDLTGNVTGNISGSSGSCTGNSATVTNATLTTALTVNTGAVTLTGNAGGSILTLGAGASSISGSNTGDNTVATSGDAALNFFGAGVTAVTDATACTDLEGTGLTIAGGILNVDDSYIKLGGDVVTAGTYDFTAATIQLTTSAFISGQRFSKSFVITNATASADGSVWRCPANATITAVHLLCKGGTVTGHLTEQDANGLNDAGVDGATDITGVTNTNVNDDGSLSNPSIDAGDYIGWRTTSITGTNTYTIITFEGYYN